MKHSKYILSQDLLLWIYPLLLIVPNVWLTFTESWSVCSRLTGIALPLGIYYIIMGIWKRTGLTVLCSLPISFFCAFQIVLLYLYGESIIAIDMFMNVATTNVGEATELLGNLSVAVITVLILYVPPLVLATYLVCGRHFTDFSKLRPVRITGCIVAGIGLMLMLCAYVRDSGYRIRRELFPVNVYCNLVDAVHRVGQAGNYSNTSASYKFHAVNLRNDSVPEVYVFVIGETSRADNWQLFGYGRNTNPKLSRRNDILRYGRTLSESNTTHKSVPMLLSNLTADNFGDSVAKVKSIFEAFNEAGIHTVFLTNQAENHSYIDFYASQAREYHRICSDGAAHHDQELLAELEGCLRRNSRRRMFVTLHTYGSHYCYHERYTPESRRFIPDDATIATAENRTDLVNAYDNTILYTDRLLDDIIGLLGRSGRRAVLVYTSDHGEDIFDDSRGRFLHASPTPTYWQLHVPMLIWMSPEFEATYPALYVAASDNQGKNVSSSRCMFDTILQLAGVATDCARPERSICSGSYIEPDRRYLNDYNEGVPLSMSGLREPDFSMLTTL